MTIELIRKCKELCYSEYYNKNEYVVDTGNIKLVYHSVYKKSIFDIKTHKLILNAILCSMRNNDSEYDILFNIDGMNIIYYIEEYSLGI